MTEKIKTEAGKNISNPYDEYTNNALTEVTLYQISSKKKRNKDVGRPRISFWTNKEDTLEWVNLNYAYKYLHRFFYFKPYEPFEIHKSDLTSLLIERLEQLQFLELNKVMVEVVRRILEAVDSFYYHTSGIHDKILWRIVD